MYTTRTTLLEKIAAGDEIGWTEFFNSYRPLVLSVARKCGVPNADADDIVQKTMLGLFHDGNFLYRRDLHGKFRTWFGGIIRHKVGDYFREIRRSGEADGAFPPENLPGEVFEAEFLDEYRKHLLHLAMEELKTRVAPEVFDTFALCLTGCGDKEVARMLGIRSNTVTVRKRRCAEIMNSMIRSLNDTDSDLSLPPL